ncbi:MAG: hypothetical protein WC725_04980 [Patescibacteria group bacterium]
MPLKIIDTINAPIKVFIFRLVVSANSIVLTSIIVVIMDVIRTVFSF